MKLKSIILLIALSLAVYADTHAIRGSIISADGFVLAGPDSKNNTNMRTYPAGNLLAPIIGYTQSKTINGHSQINGITGLEKFFDDELNPQQHTPQKAQKYAKGMDLKLNIPISLQKRVESITDNYKKELDADEIIAVVMESKSGKVLSLASSNRFDPNTVRRVDNASLNINAIEYSYEPGTIIKPFIFSMLLEKGLVDPNEMVDCHNGKFVMGQKTIVDEHKFKMLSAEDVIVHSSYIGIAQLAQRLNGKEFTEGLSRFGFTHFSDADLPYEKRGSMPTSEQLDNYLYKAITSYGYGMRSNIMQMVRAYNVFNNNGHIINPMVVNSFIDEKGKAQSLFRRNPYQVISPETAQRMKQILIKTVNEGTATIAKTSGLEIGGKNGAAHIAKDGKYLNSYNTSFVGFVNDEKHSYTIGITVIEPRTHYHSSITAVPVFKLIVDMMVKEKYLKPMI